MADPYFCQWCANGAHARCSTDRCACRQAHHRPDLELARRMLTSAMPDMRVAIERGYFDGQLKEET